MRLASGIASPAARRVAAAVPALVLGAHGGREVGERRDRADDALADRRVRAHDPPLGVATARRLLQDRLRDAELADVVQERDLRDGDDLLVGEPELLRDRRGELHDGLGVLGRVALARLERGEQRLAGGRLALEPRGAAPVLLAVDLVGDDPRQHLEQARVAFAQRRRRVLGDAAERAVDGAVDEPDRHADVRADARRAVALAAAGVAATSGTTLPTSPRSIRSHSVSTRGTTVPAAGPPNGAASPSTARKRNSDSSIAVTYASCMPSSSRAAASERSTAAAAPSRATPASASSALGAGRVVFRTPSIRDASASGRGCCSDFRLIVAGALLVPARRRMLRPRTSTARRGRARSAVALARAGQRRACRGRARPLDVMRSMCG